MEYLKRFVLWFLTGAGFALGAVLILRANIAIEEARGGRPDVVLDAAPEHVVTDVQVVPITKQVTVSGMLTNNSTEKAAVELSLELVRDGKLVYRCKTYRRYSPEPLKAVPIQIECPAVETEKVPAGTQYIVKPFKVIRG